MPHEITKVPVRYRPNAAFGCGIVGVTLSCADMELDFELTHVYNPDDEKPHALRCKLARNTHSLIVAYNLILA